MMPKNENRMRLLLALATLASSALSSSALADEVEDAHRQALQERDSYWNCLAREYSPDHIKTMTAQDFAADIAAAGPSERQNFRVTLMDYLSMQHPDARPARTSRPPTAPSNLRKRTSSPPSSGTKPHRTERRAHAEAP
jgi:hypothetical protein